MLAAHGPSVGIHDREGFSTMKALAKSFAPYAGTEPYLHLCFSEASKKKVRAFLRRLCARGVRVWYCADVSANRAEREETERRMLGARVTVVYLDEAFRNDAAAKSRLLTCQRNGQPVICLNTDGGDSGLSIGLHADAFEAKLRRAAADDAEFALLHADGFSQELIGEPVAPSGSGLKILIGVILGAVAALLIAGVLWYLFHTPAQAEPPEQTDSVTFADETVREAVRDAIGGGLITEDRLSGVTTLRLEGDTLPDTLTDLALLPALETVVLSQRAAAGVSAHPELSAYTIELYGGASE